MKTTIILTLMTVSMAITNAYAGDIVVIGNSNVPKMNMTTVQKVYTGKFVSVAGIDVSPVAFKQGTTTRSRFLREFLKQDEDKYTAYWTVRRYIGKGVPPIEFSGAAEIIRFVVSTPGAVGYIDEDDLKPGVNVIAGR